MTIFTLFQKDLATALGICNQISPKRSDIDLFTYTKVELDPSNQSLKLSSLNSSLSYFTRVVANCDSSNDKIEFLVKTEMFANAVTLLNEEQLEISVDLGKKTMIVQGEKSKHTLRLNTEYVNDFIIQKESSENLEIIAKVPAPEFFSSVKSAMVSVGDKNSFDPMFKNICLSLFETEKKMQVVSTDKYRIVKTVVPVEYSSVSDNFKERLKETNRVNYLIDPKSLQLLIIASASETAKNPELNLKFESDFLWVQFGGGEGSEARNQMILRYGEGNYPDYEKIIPQSFACNFELNTAELLAGIKQAYLAAKFNVDNKSVTITVKPGQSQMVLSAETANGEASESVLTIYNYAGQEEDWKQSFNADFLIGYLNNVDSEQVLWESNPGKPSVLSPFGQKARQLYLVSGLK
jgi:DNA polymerase-3 subunit beta